MGLFKGAMTVRRYRVIGDVPEDFRDRYRDALQSNAFRPPLNAMHEGEIVGWTRTQNLLDTDFADLNRWLFNHYLVASLRIDKKVLPAALFKAHLQKRIEEWCQGNQRERCPAKVKEELKEKLTEEMMLKTLPRVQIYEFCWNVVDGWVIFHNTSEGPNDKFRKLFRGTFGLTLAPFSPLDFLGDLPEVAAGLESAGVSDYRPESAMEAK